MSLLELFGKRQPLQSLPEHDRWLVTEFLGAQLNMHLENLARREGRSKLAIEREILVDGVIARMRRYGREDAKVRHRGGCTFGFVFDQ